MKNLHIYLKQIVLFLMLILSLGSCSDEFLEVDVRGRLIAETTEDYNLLLNEQGLYQFGAGVNMLFIAMSPEVCILEPFNTFNAIENASAFRWEPDIYLPDQDMPEIATIVRNIYTYNKIINEVMASSNGTESEKLSIRAEALAGRAWSYFKLVNLFAKPYDTSTASIDLGFPIITEADVTIDFFEQATVQQVYDFILNDLQEAIPNLPTTIFHRFRMSEGAGRALLAKVHVFMGNYDLALTEFNNALALFDNSSGDLETRLYDYNIETLPGGALGPLSPFFPIPNFPGLIDHIENPYNKVFSNIGGTPFITEFLIHPETVALYRPTDLRQAFLSTAPNPFSPPFSLPTVRKRLDASFGILSFGVNVPDIYLLRAECKLRLNDSDGAIEDLEFLRQHRMPVTDASVPNGLSQDELLEFIIEERTREFAGQGVEWFTTRRLSTDPLFANKTYTHTLFAIDGSIKETFTLTPERLTLRFNEKFMSQNPNFTNNP